MFNTVKYFISFRTARHFTKIYVYFLLPSNWATYNLKTRFTLAKHLELIIDIEYFTTRSAVHSVITDQLILMRYSLSFLRSIFTSSVSL